MDLDPTDEQKMLADTVDGLLEKRYDANARLALLSSDGRLEPRAVEAVRRARAARASPSTSSTAAPAWASASWRWCMESLRQALVLEPYLSDGRARRRPRRRGRVTGAEGAAAARRRRRLDPAGVRQRRAGLAVVADRHRGHGASPTVRLAVAGRRSRWPAATAPTSCRHRPHARRRVRAVPRRRRLRPRAARPATRCRTACAAPTCCSTPRRPPRSATPADAPGRASSRCSTSPPPRCAPRRSARWTACCG